MSTIQKAICLVLFGALSLRAASRAFQVMDRCEGGCGLDGPSPTTIANLIQRVGLCLLQRTDLVRADWIWLLDHTIGAGSTKCLIVLAISLQDFRNLGRPLQHEDLTIIGLMPVEVSNGEVVHQQLKGLSVQFGRPLATLSDQGSDLKKGIELFRQDHPEVRRLYDIVHLVCRVIKRLLESDPRWEEHRQACCRCANHLRQSALAHLKPPRPKTKARHLNFDREIRWSARALWLLDRVRQGKLTPRQQQRLPLQQVEAQLGWLDDYRERVGVWLELTKTGQAITAIVRRTGYRRDTSQQLARLRDQAVHPAAIKLLDEVCGEVTKLTDSMAESESYPGSTEVLESLIGKGKRLLGQSGNSLTRYILSLSASTAKITKQLIREALTRCRIKHINAWTQENLRQSTHATRAADLTASPEEENLRKLQLAASPNF